MESMEVDRDARGIGPNAWILWAVLGVLSIGIGVWLLIDLEAAITTLAVLLAIALFFNGLGELLSAADLRRPWVGYLIGALYVAAGIVVLIRPGKSLWFLAIFVGISIVITGIIQLAVAVLDRDVIRHWPLLAFLGALSIVVGILAIAWPSITVTVLALLIGIRLIIWGIVQLTVAFSIRSLTN